MNEAEQSINPIKTLTAARLGVQTAQSHVRPQAKSLSGMLRLARETARVEDFVWGILSAATVVVLLVSMWV